MIYYAIHKRIGCIKKISDYAVGWINKSEWIIWENFPTQEQYYSSVKETAWMQKLLNNNCEIENKGGD